MIFHAKKVVIALDVFVSLLFFGPLSFIWEVCSLKVILRDLRRITDQPFKYSINFLSYCKK